MAQRKTDIYIENRHSQTFNVYSDLTRDDIGEIKGIVSVDDLYLKRYGYLVVSIDKRYDTDEILEEIKTKAME